MMDFFFLEYTLQIGVLGLSTMGSLFVRGLREVLTRFSNGILGDTF